MAVNTSNWYDPKFKPKYGGERIRIRQFFTSQVLRSQRAGIIVQFKAMAHGRRSNLIRLVSIMKIKVGITLRPNTTKLYKSPNIALSMISRDSKSSAS